MHLLVGAVVLCAEYNFHIENRDALKHNAAAQMWTGSAVVMIRVTMALLWVCSHDQVRLQGWMCHSKRLTETQQAGGQEREQHWVL